MSPCLFCSIADGQIPATRVAETVDAIAFMDINPAVPGHMLVIPRLHSDDAFDASSASLGACMDLAARVGRAAVAALDATGITLLSCSRPDGWQTVFHLHVHVLPRHQADGLTIPWPCIPGDSAEIAENARRLRRTLEL